MFHVEFITQFIGCEDVNLDQYWWSVSQQRGYDPAVSRMTVKAHKLHMLSPEDEQSTLFEPSRTIKTEDCSKLEAFST